MKVFVFDFDNTMVDGHTHNIINRSKRRGANKEQEYDNSDWSKVHGLTTIGSDSDWKQVFETLWQQGHYLSIASFNAYKPIIPLFLTKIGLSEDFIQQKIDIIAMFPKDPKTANKNNYIKQALDNARTLYPSEVVDEVILIDDSVQNIQAAERQGYTTILANQSGTHLKQLLENYVLPPVNRHLKPHALEAAASLPIHCYITPEEATSFDPNIFADFTRNPDGSTLVTYPDQSTEHFFSEEPPRMAEHDQFPPANRHLKPHATDVDIEGNFAELTLSPDGSTGLVYADQSCEGFFSKEEEKIEESAQSSSISSSRFYNFFSHPPGRRVDQEPLTQDPSIQKSNHR